MAFPSSWPPRLASGIRSIRFFIDGTATAAFADRGFMLLDAVQVLDYKTQAANFTVGETITGQKSGATGVVFSDVDAGTTGTLTLRTVSKTFDSSEQIIGSVSGDATTNGPPRYPANPYTPLASDSVPSTPWGSGVASGATPAPAIWAQTFRICCDSGAALEYSFDGTNVHGKVLVGEQVILRARYEAGIAVRGLGAVFRIEGW